MCLVQDYMVQQAEEMVDDGEARTRDEAVAPQYGTCKTVNCHM